MLDLERLSGIPRSALSYIESGRMVPTSDEFDRVYVVLREEEARQSTAGV